MTVAQLAMKRIGLTAAILFTAVEGPANSAERERDRRTPSAAQVAKRTLGPKGILKAGAGAAISQANNTPSEWGQAAVGFGKRFGSAMGKHILRSAIHYPVARVLHEEFGYRPSGETRFGPRLKYALMGTVITHKTTTGRRTVAVGEISGAFGSGLMSRLWQPASTRTLGAGFASGGVTLGADAGFNVAREFWPEIRHPHRHKVSAASGPRRHGP